MERRSPQPEQSGSKKEAPKDDVSKAAQFGDVQPVVKGNASEKRAQQLEVLKEQLQEKIQKNDWEGAVKLTKNVADIDPGDEEEGIEARSEFLKYAKEHIPSEEIKKLRLGNLPEAEPDMQIMRGKDQYKGDFNSSTSVSAEEFQKRETITQSREAGKVEDRKFQVTPDMNAEEQLKEIRSARISKVATDMKPQQERKAYAKPDLSKRPDLQPPKTGIRGLFARIFKRK